MDAETREALEKSIKHWEENVKAETLEATSIGADDCALCQMFDEDYFCSGCPVSERTGLNDCRSSPYERARRERIRWLCGTGTRDEWRAAAQAELDFLISLRPE